MLTDIADNGRSGWPRRTSELFLVGIPVAAHQESWETIERTLDLLRLQTSNPRHYRVFLLLNSPEDQFHNQRFENTRIKIDQYKHKHPEFRLSIDEQAFPVGSSIGRIRAHLWDGIIDWTQSKGNGRLPKNLVGLTTDIDTCNMSQSLIFQYQYQFDAHPWLDIGYGRLSFAKPFPDCFEVPFPPRQMPFSYFEPDEIIHDAYIVNRFVVLLNRVQSAMNARAGGRTVVEANIAFRLSAYVKAGGIDPEKRMGEVLDLRERILVRPRNGSKRAINEGYIPYAFISTDSRRIISALAKGIPIKDTWNLKKHDFTQDDQLRESEYLAHLVRGAALKIVQYADRLAYKAFPDDFMKFFMGLSGMYGMESPDPISRTATKAIEQFLCDVECAYNDWMNIGADEELLRSMLPELIPNWLKEATDGPMHRLQELAGRNASNAEIFETMRKAESTVAQLDRQFLYELAGAP